MNKQEGFTLIEMISVIALIGVIGLTMTLGLSGIQKNQKIKKKDNAYAKVKSAMNVYTSTGGTFKNVNNLDERLNTLVEEELITEEDKNLCKDDDTCQDFVIKYVDANKNIVNDISSNTTIKIAGNTYNDGDTVKLTLSDIVARDNNKWTTTLNIKADENAHILVSANNSQITKTGSLTSYNVKLKENGTTRVTVTIYDKNYINKKTITYNLEAPVLNYIARMLRYAAFQDRDEDNFNYINPSSTESSDCSRSITMSPSFNMNTYTYDIKLKKSCKYVLLQFFLNNSKVSYTYNAYFGNGISSCNSNQACYVIAKLAEKNYSKIYLDSTIGNSRTTYTFNYKYIN